MNFKIFDLENKGQNVDDLAEVERPNVPYRPENALFKVSSVTDKLKIGRCTLFCKRAQELRHKFVPKIALLDPIVIPGVFLLWRTDERTTDVRPSCITTSHRQIQSERCKMQAFFKNSL